MPNPHDCETFDFPVKTGPINYTVTKLVSNKPGAKAGSVFLGDWQTAVNEALGEARDQGETLGQAAMKGETCKDPCERLIYVESDIKNIKPAWQPPGKNGTEVVITITGTWEAGILCFKRQPKESKAGSK